jgi:hypothetical protein
MRVYGVNHIRVPVHALTTLNQKTNFRETWYEYHATGMSPTYSFTFLFATMNNKNMAADRTSEVLRHQFP